MKDFSDFFRNPHVWDREIVAVGGDLSPERLLYAYKNGIFPWSDHPILWYCLDPRGIFDLNKLHISKRLKRKINQRRYTISFNRAFEQVMRCCAYRPGEETWITDLFIKSYTEFHKLGYAHSLEVWDENGNLGGGVYGVAIGNFFAGESMFSFISDFGKIGLFHLFEALKKDQFTLFDTQQLNIVTLCLGAYQIPKKEYLRRLESAVASGKKWNPLRTIL
ncbi:leucyl/phenylalanyl-tRNA--protein transferase [Leptospira santarosai]|uniref:leucyl/phenylalanyl-tRNA--protein transferase n=1 Tax=Leptospira santarosai TaxID=28183 RepID=UPI0022A8FB30|nr:leucyl/phenylalanyl-tRNA--protein transferase [Leptospira santarosai]UZN07499.1 leucyl/phenylalanyl-tRNA--protein transferase [Leptospira santarosai]